MATRRRLPRAAEGRIGSPRASMGIVGPLEACRGVVGEILASDADRVIVGTSAAARSDCEPLFEALAAS